MRSKKSRTNSLRILNRLGTIAIVTVLLIQVLPPVTSADLSPVEPGIPSYDANFENKPKASSTHELGYNIYTRVEYRTFLAKSKGVLKIYLENKGDNDLFIYQYGLKPGGVEDTGITIHPGQERYLGMATTFIGDVDSVDVKIVISALAKGRGKWYDYGTIYLNPMTLTVEGSTPSGNPTYVVDRGMRFEKVNNLVFPLGSSLRSEAVSAATAYPGEYNIYQICSIFDRVSEKIEYVSDPPDQEYWQTPTETLFSCGGDCDDHAILIAAMIEAIGGTSRVYLTDDHMFAAFFVGGTSRCDEVRDALRAYYNTPLMVYFIEDEYGAWMVLDATKSIYAGGSDLAYKACDTVNVIDVSATFKDMRGSVNISSLAFCDKISVDGIFTERADSRYASGDTILIYYDITDFTLRSSEGGHEVWLTHSIDIYDDGGESIFRKGTDGEFHETSAKPPDSVWTSTSYDTSWLGKGRYRVLVTVEDLITGERDETSAYFEITTERAIMPAPNIVWVLCGIAFVGYFVKRKKGLL
ncbi:MAG: hypothetical protein SYNGOMJ08_00073 [Candidatus Syntrophoarchaeum sp. GoM_oil]|nr:MAG: hypothetical protein SYNGOMJ08_00073 [Candidatus Syntrophoarchaeum sp. GoM_oil]